MRETRSMKRAIGVGGLATGLLLSLQHVGAQKDIPPTNDLPNPFRPVADYFKLPSGRAWGSTSAVEIDKDGKSVWIAERCSANSCVDAATGKMSPLDPILKFDENGNLV